VVTNASSDLAATRWFRRLAVFLACWAYGLVVLGGVVRITGSGLGCPDWPLCYGRVMPPAQINAWIEHTHRLAALVVGIGGLGLLILGLRQRRHLHPWTMPLTVAAAITYIIQAAFGALTVVWKIPPFVAWVHTGLAMALFGLLIALGIVSSAAASRIGHEVTRITGIQSAWRRFPAWITLATAAAFVLLLTGAYVTRSGASLACPNFPACGPANSAIRNLQDIQMLHRFAAFTVLAIYLYILARYSRILGKQVRAIGRWNWLMLGAFAVQIGLGIINVLYRLPIWARGAHLAGAAAIWAGFVTFYVLVQVGRRAPLSNSASSLPSSLAPTPRSGVMAYVMLTKPYIIVLLLITTLGAMLIAGNGALPLGLAFWTLLGGGLAAAAANTLNAYLERDLDYAMSRTRRRPVPSGRIPPQRALAFGLALSALSLIILATFVNRLSAALAAFAIFYYVVIYTLWLKRRTPHNIILGGAAGALPPVIGWVAVTGRVELLALYLFAIVFYWTPPHTWALTLLVQTDYARARIPMWPVARGEADTRQKIVLYTLLMFAITIAPAGLRLLGPAYLFGSLLFGGVFLGLAFRLYHRATKASALSLYKYSTLYLALLFAAMVVDRAIVM
jgi:protoheme IX farnesyltransferase